MPIPISFPPNMEHFRKIKALNPSELPIKLKPIINNILPSDDTLFTLRRKSGGYLSILVSEPKEANQTYIVHIDGPSKKGYFVKTFRKFMHQDGSYTLKVSKMKSSEKDLMFWEFEHDANGKLVSIVKFSDYYKQERVFPKRP